MSLFQNTQRVDSAEPVSSTRSGNVVWRIRLGSGEVYLTEPDAQVNNGVTNFIGKMAVVTLRHNRITHLTAV